MQLIEIIDLAREYLKDELDPSRSFPDDTSTFFKDTTLIRFFQSEQKRLQNKLVQSFENYFVTSTTISIVADQEDYGIPSATIKILRIEDIEEPKNPVALTPISFNQKDSLSGSPLVSYSNMGVGGFYAIRGDSIILRPIPTRSKPDALKMYYVKEIEDITSATSVSEIPTEYHELLAVGIALRGLIKQETSVETIAALKTHYNELFTEMAASAENRQIQGPRKVKKTRWR
jgi:hypothetical protein